jgi:ankyrin repeat protein
VIVGQQTAFHLAVGKKDTDLVNLLLNRGAESRNEMRNYVIGWKCMTAVEPG